MDRLCEKNGNHAVVPRDKRMINRVLTFPLIYYNLGGILGNVRKIGDFNYLEIKNQKWNSEILTLIVIIYKGAGK